MNRAGSPPGHRAARPPFEGTIRAQEATVSAGVGTTFGVFIERADGGILVDVDGNQLIDFGSSIAVTSVGNAAPAVVEAVRDQVAAFTHLFHDHPVCALRRGLRAAGRTHAR
jgi:4-aminobutyrate aminotransferase-like enzyme